MLPTAAVNAVGPRAMSGKGMGHEGKGLKEGKGNVSTESGVLARNQYSFGTRFESSLPFRRSFTFHVKLLILILIPHYYFVMHNSYMTAEIIFLIGYGTAAKPVNR